MAANHQPKLGYVKYGSRCIPAVIPALGGAIALSTINGVIAALFRNADYPWWQVFLTFWICTAPVWFTLVWVLVVDRSSLAGAIANPEHSVESQWADGAAVNSFMFLSAFLGLVTAVLAILNYALISGVLASVLVFMLITYGAFYVRERRRGR